MSAVREEFGLKIVTEAVEESHVDLIEKYGDVIQIGARNMQNFSLLKRAGRSQVACVVEARHGCNARGMVARGGVHHG